MFEIKHGSCSCTESGFLERSIELRLSVLIYSGQDVSDLDRNNKLATAKHVPVVRAQRTTWVMHMTQFKDLSQHEIVHSNWKPVAGSQLETYPCSVLLVIVKRMHADTNAIIDWHY